MRVLTVFAACCVALGVVFVARTWQALRPAPAEPARTISIGVPPRASQPTSRAARQSESQPRPIVDAQRRPDAVGNESSSAAGDPVRDAPPPAAFQDQESSPAAGVAEAEVIWPADSSLDRLRERLNRARAVLREDAEHPGALRDAWRVCVEARQWHAAAEYLGRLVRAEPEELSLRAEYAELLLRLKRFAAAATELRELTQQGVSTPQVWYNLAVAHQELGQLADALACWNRVLEQAPGHTDARARRGEVLLDLLRWQDAAADFEQVIAAGGDAGESDPARMNLSLAYWRLGRLEDACAQLEAVLAAQPSHLAALERLATVALELYQLDPQKHARRREQVVECARRGLEIAPHSSELQRLLTAARQP